MFVAVSFRTTGGVTHDVWVWVCEQPNHNKLLTTKGVVCHLTKQENKKKISETENEILVLRAAWKVFRYMNGHCRSCRSFQICSRLGEGHRTVLLSCCYRGPGWHHRPHHPYTYENVIRKYAYSKNFEILSYSVLRIVTTHYDNSGYDF